MKIKQFFYRINFPSFSGTILTLQIILKYNYCHAQLLFLYIL